MTTPTSRLRLLDILGDTLIATGLVTGGLLAFQGRVWGVALVLLAVAGMVAQIVLAWRARTGTWTPLGRDLVLRSVAVTSVAAAVAGRSTPVVAGLAALVLLAGIAAEPIIARAVRFTVPVVVGIDGLPTRQDRPDLAWPVVVTSLVATVVGAVVALAGLPAWMWLLLVLLSGAPLGAASLDGRAKVLFARRQRRLLPQALAAYAPEFVLYTSRPDDASYQITMWLPYLKQSGRRFVIISRNRIPALALTGLTDVPVIEARGIGDLDSLIVGSLRAAFYVNASSGNGALVRFQHLTHVYLGHGDSDKPPSYNPTHAMYDQVFAAGPAAARRYAAHGVSIPAEKFRIVGRPQVESVKQIDTPIASVTEPVVLYAPTWRGHVEETALSSLSVGEGIVAALLIRRARVIFRPHPFSYEFPDDAAAIGRIQALLTADQAKTGRQHRWGAAAEKDLGILDCINASDAMVTDVSSVVSDYLFSGKPFAMIAVPAEPAAFLAEFPVARASYVVRGDLADLGERLDAMLDADPLAAERRATRADYLGDFPADRYAATFVGAVRDIAGKDVVEEVDDDDEVDGPDPGGEQDAGEGATGDEGRDGGSAEPARGSLAGYAKIVIGAGTTMVATALAGGAFVVALAGGAGHWVLVLAALALWAGFQPTGAAIVHPGRWRSLITAADEARAVVAMALLALVGRDGNAVDVTVVTILVAVISLERLVRSWWSDAATIRHLPVAYTEIADVLPHGLLAPLSALIIVFGLIVEVADGPRIMNLIAVLVFAVIAVQVIERALRVAAEAERTAERLRPALDAYAPKFVVYFASTVGASYQVGMWLPYFLRIGRPFVIITRTPGMLRQIEELCRERGVSVPLIYRRTLRDVEESIVDSMAAAFYVNNAARNTHFVERREITHVWLNHGDSEKPACFNPVHAIYDLIFAAGQAGVDRYARHGVSIPAEKFRIVGRPQVEQITTARGRIADLTERTVLYAPTWQGPFADSRVYSLPAGARIVRALLDRGARVIFRAHPFNYRYPDAVAMIQAIGAMLDADRARTGRKHLWGADAEQAMSIEDCFNASDAMISDVSAVVSDYLRADKPFAIVSVGRTPEQLLADVPAARAAYVMRDDLGNLESALDDLLATDSLAKVRQETKVYYLGDFPDASYASGFIDAARAVIDRPRTAAAATSTRQ